RPAQVFVRGQGSWLWDSDGRAFLDFTQGLAVNCLGHSPSVLVQALARQARELVSAGPGLLNRPVLALAQRLCLATGSDQLGTHHGNALMTAAGLAVLNTVLEPGFLE
ncbi:aminotransferase class III-fold pyridoxal phosphate-dependent enzyme, partial [Acinetobacter baumannii]|uniref:aminotransferase class III-fold pyridoxal phosphate-dependent enzyme n=1 Tax=Acinetobacter baumannii TaxID=470 RepID=UPI0021AE81C6